MDIGTIWTIIGSSVGVVALIYAFLRNLKIDLQDQIGKLDSKITETKSVLTSRIDELDKKFTFRIDELDKKFTFRVDDLEKRLIFRIDELDKKIDEIKHDLNKKIDDTNVKIDKVESKLESKTESFQHAIIDINTRLYGIEMILRMKECCMIKDERQMRKAE